MVVNYLVVGLGNHGLEYRKHRHNVGYIVIESICNALDLQDFQKDKSNSCMANTIKLSDKKFFFVKPETYMNNSGICLQQLKRFYKIENQNIIVIYDEVDLIKGKCKISTGGGDNGHNGIKSIDSLCGKDYNKFKIGVGRPENKEVPLADFVLSDFSKEEIIYCKEVGKIIAKSIGGLFGKDNQSVLLNKLSKLKLAQL